MTPSFLNYRGRPNCRKLPKSLIFCKENDKSALLMEELLEIINLRLEYLIKNLQKSKSFTTVERHSNNRADTYDPF